MYCTDVVTGETLFQFFTARSPSSVILETVTGRKRRRVAMKRAATHWFARLKLPMGWHIYRFEADGKPLWDRTTGKMKTADGLPCSLAVIQLPSAPAAKTTKPAV